MSPPILRAGILGHVSRTARCASRAGLFVRPMSDDGSAHKAHKPNENEAQETAKKPLPQPSIASNQLDKLVPDLNVSTDEPFRIGGETTGAQAKGKRSMSSIEKRRQMRSRIMLALAGLGAVAGAIHLSRDWEDDSERKEAIERTKKAGESAVTDSWWSRLYNRLRGYTDVFDKPAWSELLPPMMPPPHQRPYTLLVDLEGLLVSSSWDVSETHFTYFSPLIQPHSANTAGEPPRDQVLSTSSGTCRNSTKSSSSPLSQTTLR